MDAQASGAGDTGGIDLGTASTPGDGHPGTEGAIDRARPAAPESGVEREVPEREQELASTADLVQGLVRDGHLEEAIDRLRRLDTREVHDHRLHLKVADLCEELGLGERLVVELNFAFRDAPADLDILQRLGHVHADAGRNDRAVKCWRAVTERAPHDIDAWEELGANLCELNRLEEAHDAYARALEATKDPRFQARMRSLDASPVLAEPHPEPPWLDDRADAGPSEPPFDTVTPSVYDDGSPGVPTVSEAVLVRFVQLFSGREGVYARQWASAQGSSGYTPIREPFTLIVARNHLLGNHTVGIYPLRLDNTVNFAAIDLDLSRALVDRSAPGQAAWEAAMGRLSGYAQALRTLAADHGLPMYLEDSGSKGRHCWIFFAEPLLARWARRLGAELVRLAGPAPADVGIEIFPKQMSLGPDGLGNLIKLPLGIHRVNGRRALFLDERGVPLPKQEDFLFRIARATREAVVDFVERVAPRTEGSSFPPDLPWEGPFADGASPGASSRGNGGRGRGRRGPGRDSDGGAGDENPDLGGGDRSWSRPEGRPGVAPPALFDYSIEADAEVQLVLGRCPVLRELADHAEHDSMLTNDEAIVLIHSLGHLGTGPQAVNTLLRHCPSLDASMYLKSRLRGSPISCPKIRMRIPQVTARVRCNCEFDPAAGLYPTPVLHLQTPVDGGITELSQVQFQALLQDFLRLRTLLHDTQRQFDRHAARIAEWFDRAGIDRFETSMGTLERTKGEDGRLALHLKA